MLLVHTVTPREPMKQRKKKQNLEYLLKGANDS